MKHLILVVDALGKSTITESNTPRLLKFFQHGTFKGVRTLLGYSNAIIPSIFSGTYPSENGVWALYKLSPSTTPFTAARYFPSKIFDHNLILRYLVNKTIFQFAIRKGLVPADMVPANVPINLLRYFDISMKSHFTESNCLGSIPTLFDELRSKNIEFRYSGYPWHKGTEFILNSAKQSLENESRVVVAYIDEIDHAQHLYGVSSNEFISRLHNFDDLCTDFLTYCERSHDTSITVLSDHGMRDVVGVTDLLKKLKSLPLKLEKDYILFLDSTIGRIWYRNERAKQLILDCLANSNDGHVLSNAEIMKFNIKFDSDQYGDCIYLADPGKVIYPNFYTIRGGTVKAMHGWSPDDSLQDSFYFSTSKLNKSLNDVTGIFYELKKIIGI